MKSINNDVHKKVKILQIYFERYYTINITNLLKKIDEVLETSTFENIIKELDSNLCSKFEKIKIEKFNIFPTRI